MNESESTDIERKYKNALVNQYHGPPCPRRSNQLVFSDQLSIDVKCKPEYLTVPWLLTGQCFQECHNITGGLFQILGFKLLLVR